MVVETEKIFECRQKTVDHSRIQLKMCKDGFYSLFWFVFVFLRSSISHIKIS